MDRIGEARANFSNSTYACQPDTIFKQRRANVMVGGGQWRSDKKKKKKEVRTYSNRVNSGGLNRTQQGGRFFEKENFETNSSGLGSFGRSSSDQGDVYEVCITRDRKKKAGSFAAPLYGG